MMKPIYILNFFLCYITFIPNTCIFAEAQDNDTKYEYDIIDSIKPISPKFVSLKKRIESFNSKINDPVFEAIPTYILAKAGFYHKLELSKSQVQCFFCNAKITDKVFNHDNKKILYPYLDHAKENPDCLYLKEIMGTLFLDKFAGKPYKYTLHDETFESLNTLEGRVESFKGSYTSHSEALSKAGFHYIESYRRTACFYCDMSFSDIYKNHELDKLFAEHAKHSPNCKYIKTLKGLIFTDNHDAKRNMQFYLESEKYKIMRKSYNREGSLKNSKSNFSNICIKEIANAGLFKTTCTENHSGHDCVRCFNCHVTLHIYSENNNPFYMHRINSPQCSFINNILDELHICHMYRDNKPIAKCLKKAITTGYVFNLQYRLDSFTFKQKTVDLFYDLDINVEDLVNSGFFYLNNNEKEYMVQCCLCNITLDKWENGDNPHTEHKKACKQENKHCKFITEPSNFIQEHTTPLLRRSSISKHSSIEDDAILRCSSIPKHSTREDDTVNFQQRLDSFTSEQKTVDLFNNLDMKVEDLASSGFFYLNNSDIPDEVQCCSCKIRLQKWDKGDNPRTEHKKICKQKKKHCKFITESSHSSLGYVAQLLRCFCISKHSSRQKQD